MFKKKYLHLKIYRDKIQLVNLVTGEIFTSPPDTKFSSPRSVVGDVSTIFRVAKSLVSEVSRGSQLFSAERRMLVQQMEDLEGGPSQIEERALQDIGEIAGAGYVKIKVGAKELSADEVRKLL